MSTKTYTTIEAGNLLHEAPEDHYTNISGLVRLDNEANTITVTLTEDELEEYQRETRNEINDDVISDEALGLLIEWLREEEILETDAESVEERRQHIVTLAQENGYELPTIEDDAEVSEGDENGAYVQAWVWVSFRKTSLDKERLNRVNPTSRRSSR